MSAVGSPGQHYARRFARKEREIADRLSRVGRREDRSAGRLGQARGGWEADPPPSRGEALGPPPKKTRTPLLPPLPPHQRGLALLEPVARKPSGRTSSRTEDRRQARG